jgi:hypothetical protein
MARPKKYPDELIQRGIRLAARSLQRRGAGGLAVPGCAAGGSRRLSRVAVVVGAGAASANGTRSNVSPAPSVVTQR